MQAPPEPLSYACNTFLATHSAPPEPLSYACLLFGIMDKPYSYPRSATEEPYIEHYRALHRALCSLNLASLQERKLMPTVTLEVSNGAIHRALCSLVCNRGIGN
jgi:hypothetical protein